MSKIAKVPIDIPKGVEVTLDERARKIIVKGPKGELNVDLIKGISVKILDGQIKIDLKDKKIENGKAFWGLSWSLINNAVIGVVDGFFKELELVGVGYRVEKIGRDLKFAIGYSHPVVIKAEEGIEFELEGNTGVKVVGIDKQRVGQVAADIRAIRKPEPYKGKGIRYKDEIVKRKQGKIAKAVA